MSMIKSLNYKVCWLIIVFTTLSMHVVANAESGVRTSVSMVCARSIAAAVSALTEADILNDLTARVSCAVDEYEVEVRFSRSNPMLRGGGVYVIVSTVDRFKVVGKKYSK